MNYGKCDFCDDPATLTFAYWRSGPGWLSRVLARLFGATRYRACGDHIAAAVETAQEQLQRGKS